MNVIENIDLSNWKKQKDIIFELHREYGINISSREWRIQVETWNKRFASGEVEYYITHSNSLGYKATTDYLEALIGRNDYIKRAVNMLNKARNCDKAFGHLHNYKFDFEKGEIV